MEDRETKEFVTAAGLRAMLIRNVTSYSSWWCGYVEVPKGHPLFDVAYNKPLPESLRQAWEAVKDGPQGKRGVVELFIFALSEEPRVVDLFDVHGSLTYSGQRTEVEGEFWYGFDCCHAGDDESVQNEDYVRTECESLARQLVQFAEV